MNRQTEKTAWLYTRLSRDDDAAGDSTSIANQKAMLEKYAADNGFSSVVHFCDDGYSGKNFDRPDWNRMIEEIESGKTGTVIVKDMSRVGRNYLQTGYFTEVYFPEKGIRFIAISNGIDSKNSESTEFAPFLNLMSEWYLKDISRKTRASKKSKGMSGRRLTVKPIFGYVLDPADKEKWIVDPDAADAVRRIFSLATEGKGVTQIARMLNAEKVERPSYYLHTRGITGFPTVDHSNPYLWTSSSVANIIGKPEYKGTTVNFRCYKESYKDKRHKYNPQDEWAVFENTHEAIVDPETWETAQRCRKTVRRSDNRHEPNPLTGLAFCADCGSKLYNHRTPNPKPYQSKATGKWHSRTPVDAYSCSKYKFQNTYSKDSECTPHHIMTKVLNQLVLEAIRAASEAVKTDEADFMRRIREASAIRQDETARAHRKRIVKERKRIDELDTLIRRIYEDNVSGKLTDKRFLSLSAGYEKEQAELEESIARMQTELDGFDADSGRADRFISLVRKYTDFTELTPMMITEFVEKIIVHEPVRSDGERYQDVDIFLNFIGKFDTAVQESEDTAAEEKARQKRARQRTYQRRYIEREKQKLAAMSA